MFKLFGVAAAAALASAALVPAMAQRDPFEEARYDIGAKLNAEALTIVDSKAFPIDQGNYEGWTLLHYAAEQNNLAMVEALLARGADPTVKTKWGTTPTGPRRRRW